MVPVYVIWVLAVIIMHTPDNEELIQRMKNDAEIERLAQYLRDNRDEIDRYLVECVLNPEI
jgi:hypothetical protein